MKFSLSVLGMLLLWCSVDTVQAIEAATVRTPNVWRKSHDFPQNSMLSERESVVQGGMRLLDSRLTFARAVDLHNYFARVIKQAARAVMYEGFLPQEAHIIGDALKTASSKGRLVTFLLTKLSTKRETHTFDSATSEMDDLGKEWWLESSIALAQTPWSMQTHPLYKAHFIREWIQTFTSIPKVALRIHAVLLADKTLYVAFATTDASKTTTYVVKRSYRVEDIRLCLSIYAPLRKGTFRNSLSEWDSGVYNYEKRRYRKPTGVSTRLPAKTKTKGEDTSTTETSYRMKEKKVERHSDDSGEVKPQESQAEGFGDGLARPDPR